MNFLNPYLLEKRLIVFIYNALRPNKEYFLLYVKYMNNMLANDNLTLIIYMYIHKYIMYNVNMDLFIEQTTYVYEYNICMCITSKT